MRIRIRSLAAARAAGAKAILGSTIARDVTVVGGGSSVGFGFGGYSGGYGSGRSAGVGVDEQIHELARVGVEAARDAGFF
jgi:hypothetical protein